MMNITMMMRKLMTFNLVKFVFLSFFVVFLDIFTTYIGLFHIGLCERNNMVVYLVSCFGVYGLVLWFNFEFLAVFLTVVVLRFIRGVFKLNIKSEYIPIFIIAYVVINNSFLILTHM